MTSLIGRLAVAATLTLGLLACGNDHSADGSSGGGAPMAIPVSGKVHGGQQPVSGARVTAYAAGDGSSGSHAVPLACVQSDATGYFQFGSSSAVACGGTPALPTAFACPSKACPAATSQIYLVAKGGNPGLAEGTDNDAIVLMAAMGPFNGIAASTFVTITELTTAAVAYAEAQMTGGPAAWSGCVDCNGALITRLKAAQDISGKSPGLDRAVARALNLVDAAASRPGSALPPPSACTGAATDARNCTAEEKLNTLADALASCVNSEKPGSTACQALFCAATPGASYTGAVCAAPSGGIVPGDTLQAALAVTLEPGAVPAGGVYGLVGNAPPFLPVLAAAPNDWMLSLNFTGGGLKMPFGVAIDGDSNVWVSNAVPPDNTGVASPDSSVSEFDSNGDALSPATGYTGGGLNQPAGIVIDAEGNVWVANNAAGVGNSLTRLSGTGAGLMLTNHTGGGIDGPIGLAIDPKGNIWVANNAGASTNPNGSNIPGSVSELNSQGIAAGASPFSGGGLSGPALIAIDDMGNVWVSNVGGGKTKPANSVTKLSSSGTPLSPANGYTGGGLNGPTGIATDAQGNVWVANQVGNSVTKLSSSGTSLSPSGGYTGGGLTSPLGLAIDGVGNVWVADQGGGNVAELNSLGEALSPPTGYTSDGKFSTPIFPAIDASGNVWVTDTGTNSIVELIGVAAPVHTPLIGPSQSP